MPSATQPPDGAALSPDARLIVRLAQALHAAGSPAHRLEEALLRIARRVGLEAHFFATPTSIFGAFGAPGEQRMVLDRVEPGEVDLERLSDLDELLELVASGVISTSEAERRLAELGSAPERYGSPAVAAGFALATAGAARLFGGGGREIVAAGIVGATIGLLALALRHRPGALRLFDLLAGLIAALAAALLGHWLGGLSPFLVTLSSLILLVPGLTLTTAMSELANRHLVAGSSRLAGAGVVFVTLAFGTALGTRLGEALVGASPVLESAPLAGWTELVALAVTAAALTVLFRARPRDVGWICCGCAAAMLSSRAASQALGPELGAFAGALTVGLSGNAFARLRSRPAAVLQLPGLILLVPGSIGFRSLAALLDENTLVGVQAAFTMLLVSVALVTGLLVANALLPTRRSL